MYRNKQIRTLLARMRTLWHDAGGVPPLEARLAEDPEAQARLDAYGAQKSALGAALADLPGNAPESFRTASLQRRLAAEMHRRSAPQRPTAFTTWTRGAAQVAAACARAHAADVPHGRLNPENVLIDTSGAVRVIGWCVDAALHGRPSGRVADDVADLAGLLYAALTGRWAGPSSSAVPSAPTDHGRVLRPRQVRAGIPRDLDALCDEVLNPQPGCGTMAAESFRAVLEEFVGDPTGLQESMTSRLVSGGHETVVLPQVPEFTVREAEELTRPLPLHQPDLVHGSQLVLDLCDLIREARGLGY